jgi:L-alanine-DL-glutamate epimerase-like enolase superfamily enzyme
MSSAELRSIRAIPVSLPLRQDWRWRGLSQSLGRWVLTRVETRSGVVGWGEATPLSDWGGDYGRHYGETQETVVHVVERILAPALLGVDAWDFEALARRGGEVIQGHPYARAAVDLALWDIRGRLAELPLYRLLGGSPLPVRIAHMLGLMSIDDVVTEARRANAEGIRAFQIKLAGKPAEDRAVVEAVREAVGSGVLLRADVNGGYSRLTIKEAVAATTALVDAGVDLVEQPVRGVGALAAVRAAVAVPVMADESCWTIADAVELTRADAADAFSVYIAKSGGLEQARRLVEFAETHGIACDVNGSLESGIGTLASVHLAAACSGVSLPAVLSCPAPANVEWPETAGRYYTDDVLQAPLTYDDGSLHPPKDPGLGIAVDEDKVQMFAAAHESDICAL